MTFRARGSRSSKEASSTTDWISGYDIAAQLAGIGEKVTEEGVQVNEKLCGLTLEYAVHSTTKALITEGYGAICS